MSRQHKIVVFHFRPYTTTISERWAPDSVASSLSSLPLTEFILFISKDSFPPLTLHLPYHSPVQGVSMAWVRCSLSLKNTAMIPPLSLASSMAMAKCITSQPLFLYSKIVTTSWNNMQRVPGIMSGSYWAFRSWFLCTFYLFSCRFLLSKHEC